MNNGFTAYELSSIHTEAPKDDLNITPFLAQHKAKIILPFCDGANGVVGIDCVHPEEFPLKHDAVGKEHNPNAPTGMAYPNGEGKVVAPKPASKAEKKADEKKSDKK